MRCALPLLLLTVLPALAQEPSQAIRLGQEAEAREDWDGARARYDEAVAAGDPAAWQCRGLLRLRRGEVAGGREDLLLALERRPQSREALLEQARREPERPEAAWILLVVATAPGSPAPDALLEELCLRYCGDERAAAGLTAVAKERHGGDPRQAFYLPWVVDRFSDERPRPAWVGGEGAPPHPALAEALVAYARRLEARRSYAQAGHLFAVVARCFPDSEAAERAEEGLLRERMRKF